MRSIFSSSILSANFAHLADDIHAAEDAGVDWIHIDVMDGSFVPNISMGPFIVEHCSKITSLPLDVHLMIVEPERHLRSFINAGANTCTVQMEACPHIFKTLQSIREMGAKAGVAINPGTPIDTLANVLTVADMILVMTVNPGYSGQVYIPEMTAKIKECKQMLLDAKSQIWIEVDGGINLETIKSARNAGADVFVAASSIFASGKSISESVHLLRQVIGE